jgi:DnaJ-class molecular chaperone
MERDGYVGPAYRHKPRAVNRSAIRYVALRFENEAGERAREHRRPRPRRPRRGPGQRPPCEVLGVREGASREEIAEAFRQLAQLYHPDKVAALAPEFQELADRRMKEINAAYRALTHRDA